MRAPEYSYSRGDRLEDRNTYFYSEYLGEAFFPLWKESRSNARNSLPPPCQPAVGKAHVSTTESFETAALLGYLLNANPASPEQRKLAEKLLQRFEVSKRIYRRYNTEFRAVLESGYDDLELYILFTRMCLHYSEQPEALPFLNALLKCIDTLIAIRNRLTPDLQGQLAWLIDQESSWVARQAVKAGVDIE